MNEQETSQNQTPTSKTRTTADQIENSARMLAKQADEVDAYGRLEPLAPLGYSDVGGAVYGGQDGSAVYVKESGKEPGSENAQTKVVLQKNGRRAEITTDEGSASGDIKNYGSERAEVELDEKDFRTIAAHALWEKHRRVQQFKKSRNEKKAQQVKELLS